jgi:serine/threonine-protein kinase
MAADRDLLFGLLALQNGVINQAQLVLGFQAWMLDKSRSLADHLEARGDLTQAKRKLLEALVEVHLEAHGGIVEKSLGSVSAGKSTRESLANLGDSDLESTLGYVSSGEASTDAGGTDPDRTSSYAVGSATSEGQRFRVLRPHARGGLGAVFVALDSQLDREVALKHILDHYADDPVSRQRFTIEAEVTGGLEHPGVVPVYGLGTYADGRPYYAMRFIRGDSLKEAIERFHGDVGWVERSEAHHESEPHHKSIRPWWPSRTRHTLRDPGRRSLELRKLLRRFIDVCNAIDYAHSRGVLHRDIKPGNVIVGKHGETLVVDWGLAKATGKGAPGNEERTLLPRSAGASAETLPGSALGTPAYMSPEQARGELDQLGPRSDVYSLGATLYCLLTGKPPQEGDDIGELLRRVQRGEFSPPRRLDPSIDRALEAVCLKGMAAKPDDRYASCRALADDVDRWMAAEPVTAWREPFSWRARRWGRRNRTAVAVLAASVLVALAGTGAVLAVQTRANAELRGANLDLKIANEKITQSNADLKAANDRETKRFNLAMDAIKLFHGEVSSDVLLRDARFETLRTKLLRGAADFYRKLKDDLKHQADSRSQTALGKAYAELADLTHTIGSLPEALEAHRQALDVRRALADRSGASLLSRADVCSSLIAIAGLQEATGDTSGALVSYQEARSRAESLTEGVNASDPIRAVLARSLQGIGRVSLTTGKLDQSLASYTKAREIRRILVQAHPDDSQLRFDLARCHNSVALVLQRMGRMQESLASHERAREIRERLVQENPTVTQFQSDLAGGYFNIAIALEGTDQWSDALASYDRALAEYQRLVEAYPTTTDFRRMLSHCHANRGGLLSRIGMPDRAMHAHRQSLAIDLGLAGAHPNATEFQYSIALTYHNIGSVLARTGRSSEAMTAFEKALAIQKRLAEAEPTVILHQRMTALSYGSVGQVLLEAGRPAAALEASTKAMAIARTLVQAAPGFPLHQLDLAMWQCGVATSLQRLGRLEEAGADYRQATQILESLIKAHPTTGEYRAQLASSLTGLGWNELLAGDPARASVTLQRAVSFFEGIQVLAAESLYELACCQAGLSSLSGQAGSGISAESASAEADRAVDSLKKAAKMGYRNATAVQNQPRLDPIRARPNFHVLMMDLKFPAEPFALGE